MNNDELMGFNANLVEVLPSRFQ